MATDKLVDFDHVTDYISREAAIALTDQHCFETSYDAVWMEEELRKLPAADVRPVVRGEWKCADDEDFSQPHVRCSNCGEYHFAWYRRFPYCPNCGADMRANLDATKGGNHD